jgi:hypothetical protein
MKRPVSEPAAQSRKVLLSSVHFFTGK